MPVGAKLTPSPLAESKIRPGFGGQGVFAPDHE
jgi:hypothetical protein